MLAGCEIGYDPRVEVNPKAPVLEITNFTDNPVFFYAIAKEVADTTQLANPCDEFDPNLSPNTTLDFPYQNITGYTEETVSVFFLWTNCKGQNDSDTYPLY